MNTDKQKSLAMTTVAAMIFVAANLGLWMAARENVIEPIGNGALWGVFVFLNVVSILWSINLLGLNPLMVASSYILGGVLAFKGVDGVDGISEAEIASAGAIYGAFGALAIGNVSAKVRLAFYDKKQIPFVFVIAGLLVLDALLNSGVSGAGGGVILNAVVLPFVLAGVVVGLVWSRINRFVIGRKPVAAEAPVEFAEKPAAIVADEEASTFGKTLKIEIPAELEEVEEVAAVATETFKPETPEPVVEQPAATVAAEPEQEEPFFPLEIERNADFVLPKGEYDANEANEELERDDSEPFSIPSFDSSLYDSGIHGDEQNGVMVEEEPLVAVSLDLDVDSELEPEAEELAETVSETPMKEQPELEEEQNSEDWLSGHLDLLNKLK